MFSTKQFAENKVFRYTAYTIVIGFALMMFLPTTISLPDLFRMGGGEFIKVNGTEVFTKNIPYVKDKPQLQASISSVLEELTKEENKSSRGTNAYWLNYMLNNWNSSASIPENTISRYRSHIRNVIQWQMNYDLANELGYMLSKEKLRDFIKKSYNLYLKDLYKNQLDEYAKREDTRKLTFEEFKIENADYYWEEYYKWGFNYLQEYYLVTMVTNPLQNGTLVLLADIDKELEIERHSVQVDFALYTYDAFLESDFYRNLVKGDRIESFYKKNNLRINVEEIGFASELDAKKAYENKQDLFKSTPSLKKEDGKKEIKEKKEDKEDKEDADLAKLSKFKAKKKIVSFSDSLYNKLKDYGIHEISSIIKGDDNKHYIYKILTKSKTFAEFQNDKKAYEELFMKYGRDKYDELKKDYIKHSKEFMSEYLNKAKSMGSFALLKEDPRFALVRSDRTDYFNQDARSIMTIEKKAKVSKKASKKTSNTSKPIDEFITRESSFRGTLSYNQAFFKEAYRLVRGEISSEVLSYNMKGTLGERDVFFVLKKVDEKLPQSLANSSNVLASSELEDGSSSKGIVRKIKLSDEYITMNEWIDYLEHERGYEVSISPRNILSYLGLPNRSLEK